MHTEIDGEGICMSANNWQIISITGFSLSGVMLLLSVFIFIKLDIKNVIGDLSGKTAAKQIRAIREQNEHLGEKRFKPDALNLTRDVITEPIPKSKSRRIGKTGRSGGLDLNGKQSYATEVLTESLVEGTELLEEETTVLNPQTTVLEQERQEMEPELGQVDFVVVKNIIVTHTSEKIED